MSRPSPAPSLVEAIFLAALDRAEPDDRAAYVRSACEGDPGLRVEVERLLAAHPDATGFLEPRAPIDAGATASIATGAGPSELAGTVVAGRYKLLETIGEGGMGTVWVAEQTKPVRRKIALKLIKAGMDSRAVLARFEAERQALAMMDHPNIARVLDGGATEQGRPFFVMEYVKGIPITEYCDQARLTVEDRLRLFLPVCRAVQHAHQKGIVHRDLKPSNILVCLYDGEPVPKVIDFGLAKAMHQALTEHTLYTGHGVMLGTPLYMSPEQAELNNLDVDTRTDVYALGVILYELLTGSTPLEKQRFQQAAWHEMLRLIKEEEAPRPSLRLSSGQATLPGVAAQRRVEPLRLSRLMKGELDWIALKALEKDRGRRYGTPTELSADVERYLQGDVVLARPPSSGYRLRKFARRHRGGLIIAASFAGLLVAATAFSGWQAVRARQAERQARQAAEQAVQARDAERRARERAEAQSFLSRFYERRQAFLQSRDRRTFLGLAGLLDEVPASLPAWRDHLMLTTILAATHATDMVLLARSCVALDAPIFDDEHRRVATVAPDGAFEVRDVPAMTRRCRIPGTVGLWMQSAGFFDGATKLWGVVGNKVWIYDASTGLPLDEPLSAPDGFTIRAVRVAAGGRVLAIEAWKMPVPGLVGNIPCRTDVWALGPARRLATLDGQIDRVAFTPDGSRFAIAVDGRVVVRSSRDGTLLRDFAGFPLVGGLAFNPSGRVLGATAGGEVAWLDPERGGRRGTSTLLPERRHGLGLRWVADDLTRVSTSADDLAFAEVGARIGSAAPLAFAPRLADATFALSEEGDVYSLETGRRVLPPPGRAFAEEARRFATGRRWLALDKGLVDLDVGRPVSMSEELFRRSGGSEAGWYRVDSIEASQWKAASKVWKWTIPERLDDLDPGTIRLWAEVVACGELDEEGRLRVLGEGEWESRRSRLASSPRVSGREFLHAIADDRLGWARDAAGRASDPAGKVALLDRLIEAGGDFLDHIDRATQRAVLEDFAGSLADQVAAAKGGGPEAWNALYQVDWDGLPARTIEGLLAASSPPDPTRLALVLDYLDLRSAPGTTPLGNTRAYRALALYRLGRTEEAAKLLEPLTLEKDGANAKDVLIRALVRKRLGQAGAVDDYRAAKAAMDADPSRRDVPRLEEAAKLFGP